MEVERQRDECRCRPALGGVSPSSDPSINEGLMGQVPSLYTLLHSAVQELIPLSGDHCENQMRHGVGWSRCWT